MNTLLLWSLPSEECLIKLAFLKRSAICFRTMRLLSNKRVSICEHGSEVLGAITKESILRLGQKYNNLFYYIDTSVLLELHQ